MASLQEFVKRTAPADINGIGSTGSDTTFHTASSGGSAWSTDQRVQSADTWTKVNSKGQFVTVTNHRQRNDHDDPAPTYKSFKTYGKSL